MSVYKEYIEELEKVLFENFLQANRYNVAKTARELGISRGMLQTKLKEYFGDKYIGTRGHK